MKNLVKNVLFTFGIIAVTQTAFAAGDAAAGAEKVAVCAACHGADGNSPAPAFPKIAGLGDKYLLKQLRDIQAWDLETDPAKKPETGRPVPEMTGMLAGMSAPDLPEPAAPFASQPIPLSGAQERNVTTQTGIAGVALGMGDPVVP